MRRNHVEFPFISKLLHLVLLNMCKKQENMKKMMSIAALAYLIAAIAVHQIRKKFSEKKKNTYAIIFAAQYLRFYFFSKMSVVQKTKNNRIYEVISATNPDQRSG